MSEGQGPTIEIRTALQEGAGYNPVMHVHDEIVSEVPNDFGSLDEFQELLVKKPEWAHDLPMACGAFEAKRYRKD